MIRLVKACKKCGKTLEEDSNTQLSLQTSPSPSDITVLALYDKGRMLAALERKGHFLVEHPSMFSQDASVIWKNAPATEFFFSPRMLSAIFSLLSSTSAESTEYLSLAAQQRSNLHHAPQQEHKRVNPHNTAESARIGLDNTSFSHFTAERQGLLWQQHCLSYQDYAEMSLIVLALKHISAGSDAMCLASI